MPAARLPGYVLRYRRILDALAILARSPDGLPLTELAAELGTDAATLREEILVYYTTDPGDGAGAWLPGIDWINRLGEQEDPATAEWVVLTDPAAVAHLGSVRMTADQVAALWERGRRALEQQPDDHDLATAVDKLAAELLGVAEVPVEPGSGHVAALRSAAAQHRPVRIGYRRDWEPGSYERVVHPYRLSHTSQGWELDAGPLDANGRVRTYLLRNIASLEVLAGAFEEPAGIADVIAADRAPVRVRFLLPQRAVWSVDELSAHAQVLSEDAEDAEVLVHLRQPYAARAALVLAPAHGAGSLLDHLELEDGVRAFARRLLAHHGFDLP
jgi:proteasome accessory factor C